MLLLTSHRALLLILNVPHSAVWSASINEQLSYQIPGRWRIEWECLIGDVIGSHLERNVIELVVFLRGGFRWKERCIGFKPPDGGSTFVVPAFVGTLSVVCESEKTAAEVFEQSVALLKPPLVCADSMETKLSDMDGGARSSITAADQTADEAPSKTVRTALAKNGSAVGLYLRALL